MFASGIFMAWIMKTFLGHCLYFYLATKTKRDPPASVSQVLGFKVCVMAWLIILITCVCVCV